MKQWRSLAVGGALFIASLVQGAPADATITYSSGFGSLVCPTQTTCYASLFKNAGGVGNDHSEVAATSSVGLSGFHAVVAPSLGQPGEPGSLTCGAQKSCLDALSTGIARTTDGAVSWTTTPTPANFSFSSVSCLGLTLCLAGGYDADHSTVSLLRSTTFGRSWTPATLPTLPHPANEVVDQVACASTTACMAHVGDNVNPAGSVLRSSDGGSTWSVVTLPSGTQLDALSCSGISAPSQCVAGLRSSTRMYFARTADLGSTWHVTAVGPAAGTALAPFPMAVGCFKTLCLLGGQRVGSSTVGLLYRSVNGGSSFTRVAVPAGATRVSAIAFSSAKVALVGIQLGIEPTTASLMRTTDAGAHFATESFPPGLIS